MAVKRTASPVTACINNCSIFRRAICMVLNFRVYLSATLAIAKLATLPNYRR